MNIPSFEETPVVIPDSFLVLLSGIAGCLRRVLLSLVIEPEASLVFPDRKTLAHSPRDQSLLIELFFKKIKIYN